MAIIEGADLNVLTSRMVRQELTAKGIDASDKRAINDLISACVEEASSSRREEEGGGEGKEAVEGGEGGATQEEAAEGGAAVETAWAPQDTEELLDAIATQDYGVSDDRSSKLTAPALRAYNQALKSEYGHYELRRGRTLPEGFTIVKVSGTAVRPHAPFGHPHHICSLLMAHLLKIFSHLPCPSFHVLAGTDGSLVCTCINVVPRGRGRSHAAHRGGPGGGDRAVRVP